MSADTTALAPVKHPQFGILPASPRPVVTTIGISQDGCFYQYGETAQTPGPIVPALGTPRLLDVQIVTRGKEGSRYGTRDYLEVRMAGETPERQYLLRLPCQGGKTRDGNFTIQHAVRSLLGALTELDLQAVGVKLEPIRGREATFVQVSLDPEGQQRLVAPSIGPSRVDLEIAVDRCRASLGLPPQFPLSQDTATPLLD